MTGPVAGDIERPTTAAIKAITRQVDEEHPESDIVEYVRISRKGIVGPTFWVPSSTRSALFRPRVFYSNKVLVS